MIEPICISPLLVLVSGIDTSDGAVFDKSGTKRCENVRVRIFCSFRMKKAELGGSRDVEAEAESVSVVFRHEDEVLVKGNRDSTGLFRVCCDLLDVVGV